MTRFIRMHPNGQLNGGQQKALNTADVEIIYQ